MKIILDLSGWTKEENVPKYTIDSGRIEVILSPPLDLFIREGDMVPKDNTKTVMFQHKGKRDKHGLPIFQYEI